LATRYPSDYEHSGRVEPGISRGGASSRGYSGQRSASRSAAPRSGQRPSSGQRSSSGQRQSQVRRAPQRSASGQRQGYSQRPPQRSGGQPPRRNGGKRRRQSRFPAFAALAAVLVLVLLLVVVKPFGRPKQDVSTNAPAVPASNPVGDAGMPFGGDTADAGDEGESVQEPGTLAEKLADADYDVGSLAAEDMAQVSDLKINTSLPGEWLNVLLLGTDERTLSDSARTDAMLICSINRTTGEVKLTSIMRDLAIDYTDIGQYNGTYRINAANYFGGPNLTMRTINEKFNMNIQYYVLVNFFGFQKIAQRVGGIEVDITEAEKDKINKMIVQQAKFAYRSGVDESDQENVYLETYGENTHLNGRQTLAYARIRKLTGGDAMRTERQRTVLTKLLQKVKQLDAIQLAALAKDMIGQVKTNLPFDDLFSIAMLVCGNGLGNVESMRMPLSGTYKEEVRNEQSMLYDCDFQANAMALYNFIYEQ